MQRRLRALPSRVGVYFVLGLVLFPRLGYAQPWQKMTEGLAGLDLPSPSEKALRNGTYVVGSGRRRSRRCSRLSPDPWDSRAPRG